MLSSYVSSNKQLSNNRNTSSSDNEIKALLVSNFEYPKILWQKTKQRERMMQALIMTKLNRNHYIHHPAQLKIPKI